MPNIKQQKHRVQIAARQRLEQAVQDGDTDRAAQEHRTLVKLLDKAAARKAIHPNKAARQKSQADRLLAGKS